MIENPLPASPQTLKAKGRGMSRQKYQRPEVYQWTGKGGEKFWKAEWRQYIIGRDDPKHRAATWPCSRFTKSKAQEECDRIVREETDGPQLGRMAVRLLASSGNRCSCRRSSFGELRTRRLRYRSAWKELDFYLLPESRCRTLLSSTSIPF